MSNVAFTMGCTVPTMSCSICGQAGPIPCAHLDSRVMEPSASEKVQFTSLVSNTTYICSMIVPSPTCSVCKAPMEGHFPDHWVCEAESCSEKGKLVSAHLSGVYPMKVGR